MQKTLKEIAKFIGGEAVGDPDLILKGISGIKEAQPGDLTFVANAKYFPLIQETKASAVIAPEETSVPAGLSLIRSKNPSLAFSKAVGLFFEEDVQPVKGIHETAVIAEDAKLGKDVCIGPYTVVGQGVRIGDHTIIYSSCFIGHGSVIGQDSLIYPHVTIRERSLLGNRVIIHSGAVIGSDGFGFINVEGMHEKIPQIGIVEIQDDVEVGANVTIDRARFDKTVIGKGTKIDNLVQIAHNVRIGEHCIIVSQAGISGSTTLENNVILAGQVGLVGHITIGAHSIVAAKSGVSNSVEPNTTVWGIPAKPHMDAKRINASLQKLPNYIKTINGLKRKIEELEAKRGA